MCLCSKQSSLFSFLCTALWWQIERRGGPLGQLLALVSYVCLIYFPGPNLLNNARGNHPMVEHPAGGVVLVYEYNKKCLQLVVG